MAGERRRIYLDYNATAPPVYTVTDNQAVYGNAGALHQEGLDAATRLYRSRRALTRLIGIARPEELIFTSGGTESIFLAIIGMIAALPIEKRQLLVGAAEHAAVHRAGEWARDHLGTKLEIVPVDVDGRVNLSELRTLLDKKTGLVCTQIANNETGTLNDIEGITRTVKEHSAAFIFTDAAQALGKVPFRIKSLNIDACALSAHKVGGPTGVGFLYLKEGTPFASPIGGGGQEQGRRGGTENVETIAWATEAIERRLIDAPSAIAHMIRLRGTLYEGLKQIVPRCQLNGSLEHRLPNTLNVSFPPHESRDLVRKFDRQGVAISSGSACSSLSGKSSHVLEAMGLEEERVRSAVRFSLGWETTEQDIDDALLAAEAVFNHRDRASRPHP